MICWLLLASVVAHQNYKQATLQNMVQANWEAQTYPLQPNQLVLLDKHSFLHKNQWLANKWSGPNEITFLKGSHNVGIQLIHNHKKFLGHAE